MEIPKDQPKSVFYSDMDHQLRIQEMYAETTAAFHDDILTYANDLGTYAGLDLEEVGDGLDAIQTAR